MPLLATTFGTFLVRQVFLTVPKDLREAAALDGVGHFRFLWEVAMPLCRPTLGALALFTFLGTWNQYLWPQAITTDDAHRTIQIGLERLKIGDIARLNLVTAGTVIAALPIFVVLIVFQRQLVRGSPPGRSKDEAARRAVVVAAASQCRAARASRSSPPARQANGRHPACAGHPRAR